METERSLIVPRGTPGLAPLTLNMELVYQAEGRIPEIAYLNTYKAPELLSVFNRAYLDISRMLAFLEMEAGSAQRAVNQRKSTIVIDIAPQKLAEKGLKQSQDLREAIVDADMEYQELCERLGVIKATQELLKGKAKGLEMAYTSVKKVLGDRQMPSYVPPTHTPAQRESQLEAGQNEKDLDLPRTSGGGFGKARF